eukprot:6714529-Prorocentrum_lima.AAC.1
MLCVDYHVTALTATHHQVYHLIALTNRHPPPRIRCCFASASESAARVQQQNMKRLLASNLSVL